MCDERYLTKDQCVLHIETIQRKHKTNNLISTWQEYGIWNMESLKSKIPMKFLFAQKQSNIKFLWWTFFYNERINSTSQTIKSKTDFLRPCFLIVNEYENRMIFLDSFPGKLILKNWSEQLLQRVLTHSVPVLPSYTMQFAINFYRAHKIGRCCLLFKTC